MKLLHILLGAFVLAAFLLTGQYMNYLNVRSGALGDATRHTPARLQRRQLAARGKPG